MQHLGTVQLETERLILRRFTLDDAEDAFRNWTNSEAVTKYMTQGICDKVLRAVLKEDLVK